MSAALVEFASGPIATLVTSFDVQASRYRNIEVYGTEATLSVPDPNTFGGPVIDQAPRRRGVDRDRPARTRTSRSSRGIGLADMLWAQRSGRAHRTSGALALHVLELMIGRDHVAGDGPASSSSRPRASGRSRCRSACPPNTFDD